MSIQFDIAKQIIAETCPNRKLKLENIRLFADIIQPKKYQKGDIILNEGDICNCLFYIEKGFIRQHYLKHDKDVIEHLACEKDVVWCIDSYFNREPTHLMMDAVSRAAPESCWPAAWPTRASRNSSMPTRRREPEVPLSWPAPPDVYSRKAVASSRC